MCKAFKSANDNSINDYVWLQIQDHFQSEQFPGRKAGLLFHVI